MLLWAESNHSLQNTDPRLLAPLYPVDAVSGGGEEFALVFPETDLSGAYTACERLRSMVQSKEIAADQHRIHLTVSVGLTEITEHSLDSAALLKRADELLYVAKNSGRNMTMVEGGVGVSYTGLVQSKAFEGSLQHGSDSPVCDVR